jgi:hypothetical protein
MAAQKAIEIRLQVAADRAALHKRQEELELQLGTGPASTSDGAAEKAIYLMHLFAATPVDQRVHGSGKAGVIPKPSAPSRTSYGSSAVSL